VADQLAKSIRANLGHTSDEKRKRLTAPYGVALSASEIDMVTRCPVCNRRFAHTLYLVMHMMHNHNRKPMVALKWLAGPKVVWTFNLSIEYC
jgi:hypothetical protein